jgi:hypothetical protein
MNIFRRSIQCKNCFATKYTASSQSRLFSSSNASNSADNFYAAKRDLKMFGEKALKPSIQVKKNGEKRYRKPKISGRKAAVLRKAAKLSSTYVEELNEEVDVNNVVHFKPSWDTSGPIFLASRPDAAAAHQRRKLKRVAEIDAQLAKQDDLLKKHRKNLQDAKPKSFFDKLRSS